jgi:hypothetical protein
MDRALHEKESTVDFETSLLPDRWLHKLVVKAKLYLFPQKKTMFPSP